MRFQLSTLMYGVAASAFACMGWILGQWMVTQRPSTVHHFAFLVRSISSALLIAVVLVGRKQAAMFCLLGLSGGLVLHTVVTRERPWQLTTFELVSLLLWSTPWALFTGSVRLACDTQKRQTSRFAFLLPATFAASWMVSDIITFWE